MTPGEWTKAKRAMTVRKKRGQFQHSVLEILRLPAEYVSKIPFGRCSGRLCSDWTTDECQKVLDEIKARVARMEGATKIHEVETYEPGPESGDESGGESEEAPDPADPKGKRKRVSPPLKPKTKSRELLELERK